MSGAKWQGDEAWLAMRADVGGPSREAMLDVTVRLRELQQQLAEARAELEVARLDIRRAIEVLRPMHRDCYVADAVQVLGDTLDRATSTGKGGGG